MKNKQTLKLAAAVVVLVVVIGAYFGVKYWNRAETARAEAESDTSIALTSLTGEDITKFSYQYNGETITFAKEDGTWINVDDRDFPVKQSSIEGKLSSVVSTTATRELEADDAAISEYGLDAPSNIITLTDSNGNETVFEIGDVNDSTGEYYCRLNYENKVYMISSSLNSMMSFDIYTVADMESYPYIETENIKQISVSHGTDVTEFDPETDSAAYSAASGLYYTSHVNYNCTDLAEYGLDNPQYTITIKYIEDNGEDESESETLGETENNGDTEASESSETVASEVNNGGKETAASDESGNDGESETDGEKPESYDEADLQQIILYVGNATDNGYYVRVDGSNQVHIMSTTSLESLLQ